MTTIANIL